VRTIFDTAAEPDRTALAGLAARSVPRRTMQARGWCPVAKFTDLQELGYTVVYWLKPGVREAVILEFMPYVGCGHDNLGLPRVTAGCYADQKAIHEAVGARVVSPGRRF